MKFIVDNWMLFFVAISSGGMLMWPLVKNNVVGGGALSPNAAVQLMNRDKAVVIDVSEKEEFASGHIGGAKNIPVNEIDAKLPAAVKNKALPLILVCPTGARAKRVEAAAKTLGFTHVQTLAGGLRAWQAENLPLEKA